MKNPVIRRLIAGFFFGELYYWELVRMNIKMLTKRNWLEYNDIQEML